MQLLATADQMQGIDRTAIGRWKIPGLVLMENAGRAFVDELGNRFSLSGKRVAIVCGKGNNGGDGYVIARHLLNQNCVVSVVLLSGRREVKGDARVNLDILFQLEAMSQKALTIIRATTARQLKKIPEGDVVVDAIFGTGFKGRPHGFVLSAIRWINAGKSFVAAIDICSGVNASNGMVEGDAVHADLTVTMGFPKIGHFIGAGRDHSGEVVIADISIPSFALKKGAIRTFRVLMSDVRDALPRRTLSAHKYSVGKVFVIGGSRKFTGAPVLCAQSAMRTGAGAVILGTPTSIHPILARKLTEVIIAPLPQTQEGSIAFSAYDAIRERSEWADVVLIGPGLSRNAETLSLVTRVISATKKPLVIDADALHVIGPDHSLLTRREYPTVLTPHTGELAAILGQVPATIDLDRVEICRVAATTLHSVVCLKGSPTVTATPSGEAYLNSTGNPGMATIGSGDVLTGIVGSLIGQGLEAEKAGFAGVLLHGLAGDLAALEIGERSVMALDIQRHIPDALRRVEQS